jgi:hypothetical protein
LTLRFMRASSNRNADATLPWRRELMWLLETQRVAISCAVVVGALGFMRLARLLGGGVFVSTYVALLLYAAVRVAQGLVAIVLRAPSVGRLFMVQRHRGFLQHRLDRVLCWLAVSAWPM